MNLEEFKKKNREHGEAVVKAEQEAMARRDDHRKFLRENLGVDPVSNMEFDDVVTMIAAIAGMKNAD